VISALKPLSIELFKIGIYMKKETEKKRPEKLPHLIRKLKRCEFHKFTLEYLLKLISKS
jgi:hypothetical protein